MHRSTANLTTVFWNNSVSENSDVLSLAEGSGWIFTLQTPSSDGGVSSFDRTRRLLKFQIVIEDSIMIYINTDLRFLHCHI